MIIASYTVIERHPDRAVSFTGSLQAAKDIADRCAKASGKIHIVTDYGHEISGQILHEAKP